jgi:hypothetical protein
MQNEKSLKGGEELLEQQGSMRRSLCCSSELITKVELLKMSGA